MSATCHVCWRKSDENDEDEDDDDDDDEDDDDNDHLFVRSLYLRGPKYSALSLTLSVENVSKLSKTWRSISVPHLPGLFICMYVCISYFLVVFKFSLDPLFLSLEYHAICMYVCMYLLFSCSLQTYFEFEDIDASHHAICLRIQEFRG